MADAFVPIHMDAERVGWVRRSQQRGDRPAWSRRHAGAGARRARRAAGAGQRHCHARRARAGQLASVVTPLAETVVGQVAARPVAAARRDRRGAADRLFQPREPRADPRRSARLRDAAIRVGARRQPARGSSARGARAARPVVRRRALGSGVAWAALELFVRTAPSTLPRVERGHARRARPRVCRRDLDSRRRSSSPSLPAWRAARRDVQAGLRAGGDDDQRSCRPPDPRRSCSRSRSRCR